MSPTPLDLNGTTNVRGDGRTGWYLDFSSVKYRADPDDLSPDSRSTEMELNIFFYSNSKQATTVCYKFRLFAARHFAPKVRHGWRWWKQAELSVRLWVDPDGKWWWLGSERSLHAVTVNPAGSNDRWDVRHVKRGTRETLNVFGLSRCRFRMVNGMG